MIDDGEIEHEAAGPEALASSRGEAAEAHEPVIVVGAGLAGCEAAWQLARRGVRVLLYDMKPEKLSPAHQSQDFAELVCSNSLRANTLGNAVGLLKEKCAALARLRSEKRTERPCRRAKRWPWIDICFPRASRTRSRASR